MGIEYPNKQLVVVNRVRADMMPVVVPDQANCPTSSPQILFISLKTSSAPKARQMAQPTDAIANAARMATAMLKKRRSLMT